MTDQEFYQEEFIVMLTIDGTSYDEIEVKVTDPNKTVRDQINSIVQVFELPKMDNGGNPDANPWALELTKIVVRINGIDAPEKGQFYGDVTVARWRLSITMCSHWTICISFPCLLPDDSLFDITQRIEND